MNKRFNIFSLKYKLMLVFGIFTSVIIFVLILVTLKVSERAVMEKVEIHLKEKAVDVANLIDARINTFLTFVEGMADLPFLHNNELSFQQKIDKIYTEYKSEELLYLSVVDKSGKAYFHTQEPIDVSKQEWFINTIKGKNFVSEPFDDIFTNNMIIIISVPIYEGEEINGALYICVNGFWLSNQVKDIVVGETGHAFVLDNTGVNIGNGLEELVETQFNTLEESKTDPMLKSVANFIAKALNTGKSEVGFYEFKGMSKIASFAKIPSTRWTVFIEAPIQEFLGIINQLRIFIITIGLIILGIALFITFILLDRISKPIQKMSFALKDIFEGDLTTDIDYSVNSKDEIGVLSNSLFDMTEKLRSIVLEINQNADNMNNASNEINETSQQLSQGANEQSVSTEEISSTMEQMQSNINQNTNNAKITEKMSVKLQKGMLEVKEKSEQATNASSLINEKINIINEIAGQTNILALNAAVEAARAGEQGKGFAVVAAEVRKLAERSKIAADEIVSLSANAKYLSDKAGESLSTIIPDIEKTASLVQEITSASIEQNSGAEQISNAIQQLNHISQNNAATSEKLASTSEKMTNQAEKLKEAVSYFKLGNI